MRNLQFRLGFTSFTAGRQEQNSLTICINRRCFRKKQDNATRCGRKVKNKVDRKIYEDDSQRKTDGYRGELQQAALNQLVQLECKEK